MIGSIHLGTAGPSALPCGPLLAVSELAPGVLGLLLALALLLLLPPVVAVVRGSFNPLEPLYFCLLAYGFLYVAKPAARLIRGDEFTYGEENFHWAVLVSIVGLVAFYIGYFCPLAPWVASYVPPMSRGIHHDRLCLCAWVFILVGAAGLWTYMEHSGGWQAFWSRPHGYGGKVGGMTAWIYQLPELMVVGFFLLLHDALRIGIRNPYQMARVAVASLGGVGVYAILWSRRTFLVWELITVFLMINLRRRRIPSTASFLILGCALLVVMGLALAYRPHLHLLANKDDFASVDPLKVTEDAFSNAGDEFDSFLAIVSLYPEPIDFDYFALYGRLTVHWIPRLVWPDKPAVFVTSWDRFLDASGIGGGSSESILGDLYIQMGVFGVIGGMLVSGALWRFFYAYLLNAPTSGIMQVFYAVAIGNFASYFAQGPPAAITKWAPFMLPSIVVAYWIAGKRNEGYAHASGGSR